MNSAITKPKGFGRNLSKKTIKSFSCNLNLSSIIVCEERQTEMAIICNDTLNNKSNIFVVVAFVLVVDVAAAVVVAVDV